MKMRIRTGFVGTIFKFAATTATLLLVVGCSGRIGSDTYYSAVWLRPVAPLASQVSMPYLALEATAVPTNEPTPNPTPISTSLPTLPMPAALRCAIGSPFSFWRNLDIRALLGCPKSSPHIAVSVEEDFERGHMLWRQDTGQIYVFMANGTFAEFPRGPEDVFNEGYDKEFSCESPASPPSPRRGFSKIWCAHAELRTSLGNVTEFEQGFCMDGGGECELFQDFANGMMYRSNRYDTLFVLLPDGTWKKE